MRLESVRVGSDVVEAVVRFAPGDPLRTSDVFGFARSALEMLPGLKGHRCDNDAGATFADELNDTEIAHFVEHASLELMALAGSPDTLRGRTTWDFAADGRGVFRLTLEYDDRVAAEAALSFACEIAAALSDGGQHPDVGAFVRRLRARRRRSTR
jgi:hypothetical protein